MNILITGANGFVGQNLVPQLINAKNKILEITIDPNKSKELYGNKIDYFYFDNNQERLKSAIFSFKPSVIIHLASYISSKDDFVDIQKAINANLMFLNNILDAVKLLTIKLFINTGSFAEYLFGGNEFSPAYFYSATKIASRAFLDYYHNAYDIKYCTVVPYTIYGGNDTTKKIIDLIYDSLENKKQVPLSPGNQILDFIHVNDLCDFYTVLINNTDKISNKSNFHLGTGEGHTLKELSELMENLTKKKVNIKWGGMSYRKTDVMYAVADISLQQKLFDWKPKISLNQGVTKYLKDKINE